MPEVKLLEKALLDIAALFEKHKIEYMVIGGLANAKWGQPRATLDIEITVWVADNEIKNVVSMKMCKAFSGFGKQSSTTAILNPAFRNWQIFWTGPASSPNGKAGKRKPEFLPFNSRKRRVMV